jgi:chromosome segregation ATPase
MPTDKVNQLQAGLTDFSPIRPFDERKAVASGKKQSNVVPLELPRTGNHSMKHAEEHDEHEGAISIPLTSSEKSTSEIKLRLESVLSRIKSEVAECEMASAEISDYGNGEMLKSDDPNASNTSETVGTSVSQNAKSITAELERRRTELFAQVRAAEAKAIEAEEKCELARAKLEQETSQRKLIEQQLRELEDDYLQRLSALEAEEAKRREAEQACENADARLKEADARVNEEIETRKQAEKARADAEAKSNSVMLALAGAEHKRAEAEAGAEAARIALLEIEQQKAQAESRALVAEENAREIEPLIAEAESIAHSANERYKAAEARLKHEVELRATAEHKLKTLEDELSSYLGLDWSKIEPAPSRDVPGPDGAQHEEAGQNEETVRQLESQLNETNKAVKELQSQVEVEQKARLAAEKLRSATEFKLTQVEAELRNSQEKHNQTETGLKKMLRKQEAELRSFSEQVTRANASTKSLTLVKANEGETSQNVDAQLVMREKIKMVSYGAVITLLLLALAWLIVEVYHQM